MIADMPLIQTISIKIQVTLTRPEVATDLVFIQNGMLDPWLKSKGLQDCTQALIYFAVAKLGEKPVDGKTTTNPEGLTAVTGPHAEAFSKLLKSGHLSCKVLVLPLYCYALLH